MSEKDVQILIRELANRIGRDAFLETCLSLMRGADRELYVEELRSLTGHAWNPGDSVFDPKSWPDYWVRTWGARGLLHVWDERAAEAVVRGLADEHWRPAEMCLKIVARHEVDGAADDVVKLLSHPLPRVRKQALRAIAVVGDTDHYSAVVKLARDSDPSVRRQAKGALKALRQRLDIVNSEY